MGTLANTTEPRVYLKIDFPFKFFNFFALQKLELPADSNLFHFRQQLNLIRSFDKFLFYWQSTRYHGHPRLYSWLYSCYRESTRSDFRFSSLGWFSTQFYVQNKLYCNPKSHGFDYHFSSGFAGLLKIRLTSVHFISMKSASVPHSLVKTFLIHPTSAYWNKMWSKWTEHRKEYYTRCRYWPPFTVNLQYLEPFQFPSKVRAIGSQLSLLPLSIKIKRKTVDSDFWKTPISNCATCNTDRQKILSVLQTNRYF